MTSLVQQWDIMASQQQMAPEAAHEMVQIASAQHNEGFKLVETSAHNLYCVFVVQGHIAKHKDLDDASTIFF